MSEVSSHNDPAPAGERGSPLILVERGDGLVLSTEVKTAAGATSAKARPGLRYIGAMRSRSMSAKTSSDSVSDDRPLASIPAAVPALVRTPSLST